jgi:GH15 family glucan-1,4-alpha-glucosidase
MLLLVSSLLASPRPKKEALEFFERLLEVRNDLGLLSEEYDPREKRQLGNFPQAFSHVALLAAARILDDEQEAATSKTNKS